MNKKGFTLVELLGVIVVIGIIGSISAVFIINSLSGSKNDLEAIQKDNVISMTKSYFKENLSIFSSSTTPSNCEDTTSGDKTLRKCTVSSDLLVSLEYINQPKDVRTNKNISYDIIISFVLINGNIKNLKIEAYNYAETMPIFKDTSGANKPILADGMIPVVYDETRDAWVKADEDSYYAYQDKVWANAVTVTNTNRTKYMSAKTGTEISMEDINSMWVWIPRYKYKIPSDIGADDSTVSPTPQIDVVFENGTEATGVDEATYRNGITADGTNVNYYTHPAFRNIYNITYDSSTTARGAWDEEITGFWVGKFETGTNSDACNSSANEVNCKDVEPIIKPDVLSLRYQNISTQFITSLKFAGGTMDVTTGNVTFTANVNNTYGLNTTTNIVNTHMSKSTEWGAVAIISNSQYGKKGNSDYLTTSRYIYINNSSGRYTGRSIGQGSKTTTYGSYSYNDKACSEAICTGKEKLKSGTGASTTGTIYGIYDMAGGSAENVMGSYNKYSGTNSLYNSGFNGLLYDDEITGKQDGISFPETKYYDLYTIDAFLGFAQKETAILGDATWETDRWEWHYSDVPTRTYPWTQRGGTLNSEESTIFSNGSARGYNEFNTWRAVLIP